MTSLSSSPLSASLIMAFPDPEQEPLKQATEPNACLWEGTGGWEGIRWAAGGWKSGHVDWVKNYTFPNYSLCSYSFQF